ncbi:MAG: hypothetical protein LUF78_01975 [Clostridiales bacterium]|nr:hypothetical protein [Clostridiales bacterium]
MEERKRKNRRAYLNDYQKDASGAYVYKGKVYKWKSPRKASLRKLWLFSGLAFGAQIAAGCIPETGMGGRPWVILPYVAALAAALSALWGVWTLTDGGDPVREHVYRQSVGSLPARTMATVLFSGGAALGELVNFFWKSQFTGSTAGAVTFLLPEAGCLLCAVLLQRTLRGLKWESSGDGNGKQ